MNAFELSQVSKVAVIGPECTGKSDLSQFLATHFNTAWVPEYARGYIDNLRHPYQQHDLLTIAHGQLRIEDEFARDANKVLICDTNLYVIKIWSQFKFGNVYPEILAGNSQPSLRPLPADVCRYTVGGRPQREHPGKREELYQLYRSEMLNQSIPFVEIRGEREQRRQTAVGAIEKLISGL